MSDILKMRDRSYLEKWKDAFAHLKFRKEIEKIEAEREAEAELPEAE